MEICNIKNECTGCGACYASCPKGAITMRENGAFCEPVIDAQLCIECGICKGVCPQNKEASPIKPLDVYAYQTSDKALLYRSSSGGAFGVLANTVLNSGGSVVGSAFSDGKAAHIVCDNFDDLNKLHGSKYVQSEFYPVIEQIKKLANEKEPVLVSGTPCQIAGIKSALKKDYDNVYFVDLICTGVMSPKIFSTYLELLQQRKNCKIVDFKFRDKTNGWTNSNILIEKADGTTEVLTRKQSEYFGLFGSNIGFRECCYKCKYRKYNTKADITIGDYWGIASFDSSLNSDEGYSIIIVNNNKGAELLKRSVNENDLLVATTLEHAEQTHKKLKFSVHKNNYHNLFMRKFLKTSTPKGLEKAYKRCCSANLTDRILRKLTK
ncbi:MAG: Coenzyme F420 hydrogenase/dehydrogenase, beta subunit C-terminal domain [Clostridia bacterium]|nr:Coenzyme F420 hydrogenase/dehydrogenase, beta subunit C-terminal domain [Clostridia bacterium]